MTGKDLWLLAVLSAIALVIVSGVTFGLVSGGPISNLSRSQNPTPAKTEVASIGTRNPSPIPILVVPTAPVEAQAQIPISPPNITLTSTPMKASLAKTPTHTATPSPTVPAAKITVTPQPTQTSSDDGPRFFRNSDDLEELTNSTKPVINLFEMEKVVHDLVNEKRMENGLEPLMWDDEIAVIARRHSEDMAANDYFAHENLRGQLAADRGDEAGYECIKVYEGYYTFGIAENLFQGWLYSSVAIINGDEYPQWDTLEEIADTGVEGWMESPGHRENILTETYDRAGMGVAIADNDKVYVTQNFC